MGNNTELWLNDVSIFFASHNSFVRLDLTVTKINDINNHFEDVC